MERLGRTCHICAHPQRSEIEAAIVAGTAYKTITQHYGGCSPSAITRHATEHIPQAIRQAQAAKEEAQALDVVRQLKTINTVTMAILKESRDAKKNGLALFAIDRVMQQIQLQAKLLGDLDERPQINIWMTPEWQMIRATIVQALIPYPDARIAVANALCQLEDARDRLN